LLYKIFAKLILQKEERKVKQKNTTKKSWQKPELLILLKASGEDLILHKCLSKDASVCNLNAQSGCTFDPGCWNCHSSNPV